MYCILYVYWYVLAEHAYKNADDRHDNGEPNYWFSGQKSKSKANKPQMLLRIRRRDSSEMEIFPEFTIRAEEVESHKSDTKYLESLQIQACQPFKSLGMLPIFKRNQGTACG